MVKKIKEMPAYKFTPIVMLTTESQDSKKKEGQAAGAKAWMLKPFSPPQLLSVVQKLVVAWPPRPRPRRLKGAKRSSRRWWR